MSETTAGSAREQLLALNERILAAERGGAASDVEYLATVLADDLVFRRADKTVVGKAAFLDGVAAGARRLLDRQAFDVEATVCGAAALVTLTVFGFADVEGERRPRMFRNIRFFADRGRGWVLERWFNEVLA